MQIPEQETNGTESFLIQNGKILPFLSLAFACDPDDCYASRTTFLSDMELSKCEAFPSMVKKKSFCTGRRAVKTALNALFPETDVRLFTVDNSPEKTNKGYPFLTTVTNPAVKISIAHTGSMGAALVFPAGFLFGIDAEIPGKENIPGIDPLLTASEMHLIAGLGSDEVLLKHLFWCSKEALGKAVRTGFLTPHEEFEIGSLAPQGNRFRVSYVHHPEYSASAFLWNVHVISLCFPVEAEPDVVELVGHLFS